MSHKPDISTRFGALLQTAQDRYLMQSPQPKRRPISNLFPKIPISLPRFTQKPLPKIALGPQKLYLPLPEDHLASHADAEIRDRLTSLRAESAPCLVVESYHADLSVHELPAPQNFIHELSADQRSIHELQGENSVEPNFILLALVVIEEFALHFDLAAMMKKRVEPCGFEHGYPRVLSIQSRVNAGPDVQSMSNLYADYSLWSQYRISPDIIPKTEELTSALASYTITARPSARKQLSDNCQATDPSPILPVRMMTIKAVKKGEVMVRSLSRPVSIVTATEPRAASRPHPQPIKQSFEWRRHADQDFEDPAAEHSHKFRVKRKELNLRRKALEQAQQDQVKRDERAREIAAAAFREEIFAHTEPRGLSWFDLLNLESVEPATSSPTPSPVDLLDAPIQEEVRKSVLRPVSNVQARITMWESKQMHGPA